MAENAVTNTDIKELFEKLSGETRESALFLHRLGEKLGLSIEVETRGDSCHIVYGEPITRRAVFTIACTENSFRLLTVLENAQKYEGRIAQSPQKVKDTIKAARRCTGCNPQCYNRAIKLTLDGEAYSFCIVNGYVFENLNEGEWAAVAELIAEECK